MTISTMMLILMTRKSCICSKSVRNCSFTLRSYTNDIRTLRTRNNAYKSKEIDNTLRKNECISLFLIRPMSLSSSSLSKRSETSLSSSKLTLSFPPPSSLPSSLHSNIQKKQQSTTASGDAIVENSTISSASVAGSVDGDSVEKELNELFANIRKASRYNIDNWDVEFCRSTVDTYHKILLQQVTPESSSSSSSLSAQTLLASLLSPETTVKVFKILLRCSYPPSVLSTKVREFERIIGKHSKSSTGEMAVLSDQLSLRLLEANGKAGNMGRVFSLLQYRLKKQYKPQRREFVYAITSIYAAVNGQQQEPKLHEKQRQVRNNFLLDFEQPEIDNPTRWLDSILFNMSARDYQLTNGLAAKMIDTYTATGRTRRALHYFYKVRTRNPKEDEINDVMPRINNRPKKVIKRMNAPPKFHKIPSQVQDLLLPVESDDGSIVFKTRLEFELDPSFSPPLSAAFSFADSLEYGACGHKPVPLNLECYNALLKVCIFRGALNRAIHIIEHVMPKAGVEPSTRTYDTLLGGLGTVGDIDMIKKYYHKMLSLRSSSSETGKKSKVNVSNFTIRAMVSGLLNYGDVSEAITVVQDFFNQHNVLPPVQTHYKIIETALSRGMVYEAKRHVYFIQQLWKWEPHHYHLAPENSIKREQFIKFMQNYQRNPKLSKESLQNLFQYFGYELKDSDFF